MHWSFQLAQIQSAPCCETGIILVVFRGSALLAVFQQHSALLMLQKEKGNSYMQNECTSALDWVLDLGLACFPFLIYHKTMVKGVCCQRPWTKPLSRLYYSLPISQRLVITRPGQLLFLILETTLSANNLHRTANEKLCLSTHEVCWYAHRALLNRCLFLAHCKFLVQALLEL